MTAIDPVNGARRRTATSRFGVSRRESHDASAFYARFGAPKIVADVDLAPHATRDRIWHGDARQMGKREVNDNSVALVVTSPPYFAGKEYEEAMGVGHVPASYTEFLGMLEAVFARCWDKLEPGGRIAVNVANLGRKPYRSLSADVIGILERLGFLMRGEIVWKKQQAAGGSCAWGTYQRPGNPVLRDITERVLVASKGRFDRALSAEERQARGWPFEGSMYMDDFVDATTDVWDIPAESATRVGHPAPFPVELPKRLIELYTYRGDLVLDPFMGGGATAVAAVRTGRYYIGFDTDEEYVRRSEARVEDERRRLERAGSAGAAGAAGVVVAPGRTRAEPGALAAVGQGQKAKVVARQLLEECGFSDVEADVVVPELGVDVTFRATDAKGRVWLFDLCGAFSVTRPGLKRADNLWRALGKAAALAEARRRDKARADLGPLVLLSTDLPARNSAGERALRAVTGPAAPVHDVVELLDGDGHERLRRLAAATRRR